MVRLISYVVVLALVVAGAVWLADRPGAVSVEWLGWRVETGMPVLLIALALLVACLHGLWQLVFGILRLPAAWADHRREGRRRKGYVALTDGLAAAAGGEVEKAQKLAGRAEKLLADPALTRLLSAQTAELTGDERAARTHFQAMLERPETAILGIRGLLKQALERGDQAEAADLAARGRTLAPADPWLADTLFDLLIKAGRLREAQDLVEDALRRKVWAPDVASTRKARLLDDRAAQAAAQGDQKNAVVFAREALKTDPTLDSAAVRLAEAYAAADKRRRAIAVLEAAWRERPSAALAQAWRNLIPGEDPLARLRRMERLVARRPDDVESHLALAQAAFDAKLWGQARRHLLAAADARPDAGVFRLLAQLEQAEYNDQAAAQAWLDKAAAAT